MQDDRMALHLVPPAESPQAEADLVIQRWQIDRLVEALVEPLTEAHVATIGDARYIATAAVLLGDRAYRVATAWLMAEAIFWSRHPAREGEPLSREPIQTRESYFKEGRAALVEAMAVFEGMVPERVQEAASAIEAHEYAKAKYAWWRARRVNRGLEEHP